VPLLQQDVQVPGEPLRVVVGQGATLTGKVVPASVLAQWAPSDEDRAMAQRMGKRGVALLRQRAPGLQLTDPSDPQRMFPAAQRDRIPLADDGSFRIDGVPPGNWNVLLCYTVRLGDGASTGGAEVLARVTGLAEGETRDLTLNASILVPGELRGLVVVDGLPLAAAQVNLRGTRPDGQGGSKWLNGPSPTTDAEGRFTASLQGGEWTLATAFSRAGTAPLWMELVGVATVRSGKSTEAVFRFERRRVTVRLLSADGQPVADREVDAQTGRAQRTERTDQDGCLVFDPAPPGTMTFFVWPEHLLTQEQRNKAWGELMKSKRPYDDLLAARIKLGEFTVPAGEKSAEVTLRLPR
jgi:hypothetical protein